MAAAVPSPKSSCPCQWTGTPVEPVHGLPDEERRCLRRRDPDRVDDDDLLRPCVDCCVVGPPVELEVGARRVDPEERDPDPGAGCEGNRVADPLEHALPRHPERVELPVRDRALDHRGRHAQLDERLHVGLDGAGEAPDLGLEPGRRDELDGTPVVRGDARKPCLDPIDARSIERPRDLQLVFRRQHDADGLLAIPQRRVVQADGDVRLRIERLLVEAARPDLVPVDRHACTIPSANGESFSGPASVMRKLSSTRSPPPPSQ